jgi:hypothetical protein
MLQTFLQTKLEKVVLVGSVAVAAAAAAAAAVDV